MLFFLKEKYRINKSLMEIIVNMKKKLLSIIVVSAIAFVTSYNVYISQNDRKLSELALSNIEALASNNEGGGCPNGCVQGWGGCYCNGWYPTFAEHSGWH